VIRSKDYTEIVIKQPSNYLALLIDPQSDILNERFLGWALSFDATSLKHNPKFQVI
jgi:hypothetical protein